MTSTILLALAVGVTLGLLGGGGSVLAVPILVYALGLGAKEAIATSLVVVGATAAVGAIRHAAAGNVRWKVALQFSAAAMIGAWFGGYAAAWFSGTTLLLLFALMMAATGVAMFLGRSDGVERVHSPWMIAVEGLVVGAATGLVGAGGGFLVVPALVLLGGLSMKEAIGTSLVVIALKSAAGFAGHATHIAIDPGLTATFTAVAAVGSLVGATLSTRIPAESLRKGFASFILVIAAVMIWREWTPTLTQAVFVEPWPYWGGGLAIGALVLAFAGVQHRLFGVSTGFSDACAVATGAGGRTWRLPFLGGLMAGGLVAAIASGSFAPTWAMGSFDTVIGANLAFKIPFFVAGGVLVGFGARLAGGCTSGHAIVGVAQRAPSSMVATASFMIAGFAATNLLLRSMGA